MTEIWKALNKFLGYISGTKIGGVVPLDIVCHLFLGYAIYLLLVKKFKVSIGKSFLTVVILSIFKEVFDSFSLASTIEENIKDIFFSVIIPGLLALISKVKKR